MMQTTGSAKLLHFIAESSSDSEEDSDPYFSVNDPRSRQKRKQRQDQKNRQSKVCVNLTIAKGKLRTSTPLVVRTSSREPWQKE